MVRQSDLQYLARNHTPIHDRHSSTRVFKGGEADKSKPFAAASLHYQLNREKLTSLYVQTTYFTLIVMYWSL